jgi:hypothetical protein
MFNIILPLSNIRCYYNQYTGCNNINITYYYNHIQVVITFIDQERNPRGSRVFGTTLKKKTKLSVKIISDLTDESLNKENSGKDNKQVPMVPKHEW